jgi:enoyl-CoA hydratase/carnithine racemase
LEKAFAAGADVKEMADPSFTDVFGGDYFAAWGRFAMVRTPTFAVVAGYVNRAFETTIADDLLYERRLFHSAFATADQTDGMAAFIEKRLPNFTHH